MSKTFYTDYVNHMIRCYVNCKINDGHLGTLKFKTEVDMENFKCVNNVFEQLTDTDQIIITELFLSKEQLPIVVTTVSQKMGVSQDAIWTMLNKVSTRIAKEKKLI